MAVVYDDDVAPAIEPGAPKRSRIVYDEPAAPAPAPAAPQSAALNNPIVGGAEDLLHHVTGGLAQIPATLVGGGAGLAQVLGANVDAEALRRRTQEALTYQPVSESGKAGLATEASLLKPVGEAVNAGLEKTGAARPYIEAAGRGAGAALAAAPFAAPAARALEAAGNRLTATGLETPASSAAVEGAAKPSTQTPLETARGAGYQAPPSVVKASNPGQKVPGGVRESIVGPSGLRADANTVNQQITTRLAGEDIGLQDAKKITAQDTANFRKNGPGPVYDATAQKLGTMATDPDTIGELRHMAAVEDPAAALKPKTAQKVEQIANQIESGNYTGDTWRRDISWLRENGGRDAANSLEDMAERHLAGGQDARALEAYRGARQDFAKSYDIQNAIGRGGQIDAQHFRMLDDKYPNLLTGNAKIVATAARELPEVTRLPGADTGAGVHSKVQAAHNALGAAVRKLPGMNPLSEGFQARNFGRQQTPTEASYNPTFGRTDQGQPTEALTLEAPAGQAGRPPQQQGMTLPQGPGPREQLALTPPEGSAYEAAQVPATAHRLGEALSPYTIDRQRELFTETPPAPLQLAYNPAPMQMGTDIYQGERPVEGSHPGQARILNRIAPAQYRDSNPSIGRQVVDASEESVADRLAKVGIGTKKPKKLGRALRGDSE